MAQETTAFVDAIREIGEGVTRIKSTQATQFAELRDRVEELEAKRMNPVYTGRAETKSLGDMLADQLTAHEDLLGKTGRLKLQLKAAADVITTTSGRSIVGGIVGAVAGGVLGVQRALPIARSPDTTACEYFRMSGTQGAAAVQAGEGAVKAAVRPDHTAIVQSALTVAGYTKLSKQAMGDTAELARAVNVTLARSVNAALDAALMAGVVTPAFTGLVPLASDHTSTVYGELVDAISECVAAMQEDGHEPDAVVLRPADWLAIVTARGTANDHPFLNYLGELPQVLRGLRCVLSPSVTSGKALVLDSRQIPLRVVDDFGIEIGVINDDFVRNQITVLGELRVIPMYLATGAARLVTPSI